MEVSVFERLRLASTTRQVEAWARAQQTGEHPNRTSSTRREASGVARKFDVHRRNSGCESQPD